MNARLLRVARFATEITVLAAVVPALLAFDICAYFDPASVARQSKYRCCPLGLCTPCLEEYPPDIPDSVWFNPGCYQTWYNNVRATNDSALKWYTEMGLTVLDNYYDTTDYEDFSMSNRPFSTMNERWPDQMYKYVDAHEFRVSLDSISAWAMDPTEVQEIILPNGFGISHEAATVYMDTSSQERTMIHRNWLGTWWGWWDRDAWYPSWGEDNTVMPWRFRLIADIDVNSNAAPEDSLVGEFVWYMEESRGEGSGSYFKFAPIKFYVNDFAQPGLMDTLRFTLRPAFANFDSMERVEITYGTSALNEVESHIDTARVWVANRRSVHHDGYFVLRHSGNHRLFVNSIQACEEGHYRMFWGDDPNSYSPYNTLHYDTVIVEAFRSAEHASPGLRYWGYDELPADAFDSYLYINRLLKDNGLKQIVQDGAAFGVPVKESTENFLNKAAEYDVDIPIIETDVYPYYGDSTDVPPSRSYGIGLHYVKSESDVAYIDTCNCRGPRKSPTGWNRMCEKFTTSLQATLDFSLWGEPQELVDFFAANNEFIQDDWYPPPGLVEQVRLTHEHGARHWTVLMGGSEGPFDFDADTLFGEPHGYYVDFRPATPEEIKLECWLAAASNTDGINWYRGMSFPQGEEEQDFALRGLLEWATSESDNADPDESDFCSTKHVKRTPRYYAAKEACNQIHEIAPVLESLEFVRTYSSRAYEESYGTSLNDWVRTDTVNTSGQKTCVLYSIHTDACVSGPLDEDFEDPEDTYVQVSRFRNAGGNYDDDYWFLVVNRRGLSSESRRVYLSLGQVEDANADYVYDMVLRGSTRTATVSGSGGGYGRFLYVDLGPAEAELIHFYKADTAELVIHGDTTLTAPAYFNRNIILDNAKVTIVPDTAIQRYTYIKGTQIEDAWKDSLEILFAPGKGIRCLSPDSGYNKLSILGNDSTQIILKCSKGLDNKWKGIDFSGSGYDTLELDYVDVRHAAGGILSKGNRFFTDIANSNFAKCGNAIYTAGPRETILQNCRIEDCTNGLTASSGSIIRATDCEVTNCGKRGITATNFCTLDFDHVDVSECGGAGIRAVGCDTWLKCCRIDGNRGVGLDIVSGSLVMTDVDSIEGRFGANWIIDNDMEEIVLSGFPSLFMQDGFNSIYDPTPTTREDIWIRWMGSNVPLSPQWGGNYWNGIRDEDSIRSHIVLVYPEFSSILSEQPEFCYLPPIDPAESPCIVEGIKQELLPSFTDAKAVYIGVLASDPKDCQNKPAVSRLISLDFLAGNDPDETLELLDSLSVNAEDEGLKHVSMAGRAYSLAENYLDTDSASALLEEIINDAEDDVHKKIDGEVGLLALDMRLEEQDTTDGLTIGEIDSYLDSLDQIVGQRYVWTQWEITDSVVLYAPMRVDSEIVVQPGGVLTIVPHPAYTIATVEFRNQGSILVNGTDNPSIPDGKLYILGEPERQVMLEWPGTLLKNIRAFSAIVKMRHAHLRGKGFVTGVSGVPGDPNLESTLQADSCVFEWFHHGVLCEGSDSTSYLRNCSLIGMGNNETYGAGLFLNRADNFLIENCIFDGNEGVGIYQTMSSSVIVRNSTFHRNARSGIYGSSYAGGSTKVECCSFDDNGNSLPELWSLGVVFDLVGGHNSFADTTGPLIKATYPSYVDIEEGENLFTVLGNGKYFESGHPNEVWDITWNTWEPSSPADSDFYDYMVPSNPAKWTIDSSLASYVGCDVQGTSSLGGGNWLIVDPWENPTIASEGMSGKDENSDLSVRGPVLSHVAKADLQRNSGKSEKAKSSVNNTKAAWEDRRKSHAMQAQKHHEELAKWRGIRDDAKYASPAIASRSAMNFVTENPQSEFVPAALSTMVSMSRLANGDLGTSKFLNEVSSTSKYDGSTRKLAKRLAFSAMAFEGNPQAGLNGLQEMMESFETPRDSLLALMDAMQLYLDYHETGNLRAKYRQIAVTDPYELVRRMIYLGEKLDDPKLSAEHETEAVPTSYMLYQNYPNPFNPNTEIRFDIPEAVRVELRVFNILGQEVTTLVDDVRAAGAYRILWDGKNAGGLSVASGVYVYQIKAGNFQDAKKMILLR